MEELFLLMLKLTGGHQVVWCACELSVANQIQTSILNIVFPNMAVGPDLATKTIQGVRINFSSVLLVGPQLVYDQGETLYRKFT